MGCCLGCFRTDENVNKVNQNDILCADGLLNTNGQESPEQDTCTHKAQEKTEQNKGNNSNCVCWTLKV